MRIGGDLLRDLRARLAARPDTEHEQAIVRLIIGVLLGMYLLPEIISRKEAGLPEPHVLVWIGFLVATLSWCLAYFGALGIPLFLVYAWVTLANGFRFGARYLEIALGLSVVGFSTAMYLSEYWREHFVVGVGMLVGLIALSLYVRTLVMQLFDAIARAESANQAKRRFISVVSHEMRTPLNAIIGMADLLRETPLNREQADMLQTLRGSSRVMLGLVEDVLDFSKIEAGKLNLERADFDLHALVNSTCRIVSSQAAAKGVDFVVSIMPDVPPAVRGDAHHLRQVLINLAGNAVKFTERGGVTVHVAALGESETRVKLKFSVRDTGIGIAPAAQARIFESFGQADQSTTRRFGGTGLGTTIAKQIVGLMGGRIGLESTPGLGSTFWFEVELDKQAVTAAPGAGELAGERVLLVGFPAEDLRALENALEGWGSVPVAVDDVAQGASRLVAEISRAKPYHSVLLYAPSGEMEMVRRYRRSAPDPAPPAVLAAPNESLEHRFEALSAGFAAVLGMPFDKRQLFNVLHSVSAREEVGEGVVRLQDYARRAPQASKLNILVADDNPTNREVLGKILSRGGHAATLVADGDEALEAIEIARYDVVLLDRNMPGMSGLEVLQALRLTTRGRERLPVIMLSADVTPEARREALEGGADAFLPKPVEAVKLLEEIQLLTSATPQDAEHASPTPLPVQSAPPQAAQGRAGTAVINLETLSHLEELGSSIAFVEKLVGVFLEDNGTLLSKMESALAGRNFGEFRALLHAMKGSAASMGTDRLTWLCASLGKLSDAELRLRTAGLVRSIADELAAARGELERYLRERKQSVG